MLKKIMSLFTTKKTAPVKEIQAINVPVSAPPAPVVPEVKEVTIAGENWPFKHPDSVPTLAKKPRKPRARKPITKVKK